MTKPLCFLGMMSSGKDVCTWKTVRWLRSKRYKRIITNSFINDEDVVMMSSEDIYDQTLKDMNFFKNSYLVLSELHLILESRSSNARVNKNFTQRLTQIGKLDCTVVYNSQLISQIDLRMREFTPYRFICERYKIKNGRIHPIEFFDGRIIEEQVAIHLSLQYDTVEGKEMIRPLGYILPVQDDYDYYKTRQIFVFDRDKYLKK